MPASPQIRLGAVLGPAEIGRTALESAVWTYAPRGSRSEGVAPSGGARRGTLEEARDVLAIALDVATAELDQTLGELGIEEKVAGELRRRLVAAETA